MIRFHVDNLMSSHVDPTVNNEFGQWLNKKYGNYSELKAVCGKVHDYLRTTLDFSSPKRLVVNMRAYVASMINNFLVDVSQMTEKIPAADDLFSAPTGAPLDPKRKEEYHTLVAKGLFLCKWAQPNIRTVILVLCTQVKAPTKSD
jgi:hypothetical protein